jgi:hypothetical protein
MVRAGPHGLRSGSHTRPRIVVWLPLMQEAGRSARILRSSMHGEVLITFRQAGEERGFNRTFPGIPNVESHGRNAGRKTFTICTRAVWRSVTERGESANCLNPNRLAGNDKRRDCVAAFAGLPSGAYEVSCRIRAGSPRGLWPHSPRTVASRRYSVPPLLGAED